MSGPAKALLKPKKILRAFVQFVELESSSGIILLACAVAAMIWANSPAAPSYFHLWEIKAGPVLGGFSLSKTLHHWINDGLMAIFFFVVGLEIKHEVLAGELSTARKAMLPLVAALGGVFLPAAIYVGFNFGGEGMRGWGVPMATDIAFALGIMALLGNRIPVGLKVFLTALAIADDMMAVLVIAIFYTSNLSLPYLGFALLPVIAMALLAKRKVNSAWLYALLSLVLWFCVLKSGIHATIAGIVAALLIPAQPDQEDGLAERLMHALHPWVAFAIMPLFALSNAGVSLAGIDAQAAMNPVTLGVVVGLVAGKFTGIWTFAWMAVKMKVGSLPDGVSWAHIRGASMLGGIGFTMALFIGALAFEGTALLSEAKIGILVGSLFAAIIGLLMLLRASHKSAPLET